jgi:uncharacterized protein (DUF433 family)
MSSLLAFVSTPGGQQTQILLTEETVVMAPSSQEPRTRLTDRFVFSGFGQLAEVPHHGRSELRSSFYDELLRLRSERTSQSDFYLAVSNFGYLSGRLKHSSDVIRNAVEMDLNIMHGNPVFQGTRIPVYQIIEELADGTSLPDILEGYPSLTLEKVQKGLDFAASVVRIYDEQIPGR